MRALPYELLLDALSADGSCFILGAGASSPHVPTMGEIPARVLPYTSLVGSFAPGGFPDDSFRQLIRPLIENARTATTLAEFQAGHLSPATVAVVLQRLITEAHFSPLPQYAIFALIPRTARVISFNWDGLAYARCRPHHVVLEPHGTIRPLPLSDPEFEILFDDCQWFDALDARDLVGTGLILPGEENSPRLKLMRDQVFNIWREAPRVVVIGYSFGIGSPLAYDGIWFDTFGEAMRLNRAAPIHLVDPNAAWLRGELAERMKRSVVAIHDWPLSWYSVSRALLRAAGDHGCTTLGQLRIHGDTLARLIRATAEQPT